MTVKIKNGNYILNLQLTTFRNIHLFNHYVKVHIAKQLNSQSNYGIYNLKFNG